MRFAVVVGLFLGLSLLAGCAPASGTGRVTIRLAADIQQRDQLSSLEVVVETAGVHHADQPIGTGWVNWQAEPHRVDLMALSPDRTMYLGTGEVPAGRYDRARVVVEAGRAQAAGDGTPVPLIFNVEPIAIPFEIKNRDQIDITIELIALAQADGGYHLFTKSAAISNR